ncbi:autotransporter outer membrane beta-barrel domain-containing protein [Kluyvera sp. CHPC 1.251]|uniref:autotransporter outer membrane beta-barrel domain-containing protein n=1 Tax=Kluyvera sp. CHPC 1.251 TaxID=2995175 RepID=UPI002FD80FE6
MNNKKCNGLWRCAVLASGFVWMLLSPHANAWQQEYIVSDGQSNTAERYTWDSDHQPRYDDILAERIEALQAGAGVNMNLPDNTPLDATKTMSIGLNIPLTENMTMGPVAAWHYDGSPGFMWNEFGDTVNSVSQSDALWHASVSTLGWRVDTHPWLGIRPWAQVSYNQQFGENQWKAQSGLNRTPTSTQDGNWVDVTLGADMLLNSHLAAYAALSQADNMSAGTNYSYMMGVSARF